MAFDLIITPAALQDVYDACIYYEGAQRGLSVRFLEELTSVYNKIRENPQHYGYISPNRKNKLRDVKIKSFPYVVIYNAKDNVVTVFAVFNTYRKPRF